MNANEQYELIKQPGLPVVCTAHGGYVNDRIHLSRDLARRLHNLLLALAAADRARTHLGARDELRGAERALRHLQEKIDDILSIFVLA